MFRIDLLKKKKKMWKARRKLRHSSIHKILWNLCFWRNFQVCMVIKASKASIISSVWLRRVIRTWANTRPDLSRNNWRDPNVDKETYMEWGDLLSWAAARTVYGSSGPFKGCTCRRWKVMPFSYSAVVYIIWKSPMYLIYVKEVALWDWNLFIVASCFSCLG